MPNATNLEPRYSCPICLGLPMQKLQITRKHKGVFLTLDCCKRCGGAWFDQGEVQLSQQITSTKVRQRITQHTSYGQRYCQSCHTLMAGNLTECVECGWHNQIACPVCEKVLQRKQYKHLTLDICQSCQGVWFDQEKLSSLWSDSLLGATKSSEKKAPKVSYSTSPNEHGYHDVNLISNTVEQVVIDGGLEVIIQGSVEAMANTSKLAGGVVESLAEMTGSALEAVGELPEAVTVILDVTGEIAGSMTEVLAEVFAGLFS